MLDVTRRHPVLALTAAFVSWKLILFAIALGSAVGHPYDTSTTLLIPLGQGRFNDSPPSLTQRLTRWDAIWFSAISSDGYQFEQSWAFGPGLPTTVVLLTRALHAVKKGWACGGPRIQACLAILISNSSHFASLLVLYQLALTLVHDKTLALLTSLLHVVTPAGLFLSAPYSEGPYAFLSFLGFLMLVKALGKEENSMFLGDLFTMIGGLFLGLATTFRSNGLLNGIPLAAEFCTLLPELVARPELGKARRVVALGVAGLLVATGSLVSQLIAYTRFCSDASGADIRPWCRQNVPSIYTFVQSYYWGVGFLRYWKMNNIPYFAMGAPMITVLIKSAIDVIRNPDFVLNRGRVGRVTGKNEAAVRHGIATAAEGARLSFFCRSMSAVQLLLAGFSITNYHVQIITRLSSGYPIWYLWLAAGLRDKSRSVVARKMVIFIIMYCCIQGVLFAYFLPPA